MRLVYLGFAKQNNGPFMVKLLSELTTLLVKKRILFFFNKQYKIIKVAIVEK